LDKLKNAQYFTKLDICWGYNNIWIKERDKWKTAFKTKLGIFKPIVMFFGLCNSSVIFQKMIDILFLVPLMEGWILVYIDDILIFAPNKELLKKYTHKILQILANNDLYLNLEKCKFKKEEIKYLGFIISSRQIKIDPKKVYRILYWPKPKTVHQVHLFLGFGNFYHRFIYHYSKLARPLINLTKKDQLFS